MDANGSHAQYLNTIRVFTEIFGIDYEMAKQLAAKGYNLQTIRVIER